MARRPFPLYSDPVAMTRRDFLRSATAISVGALAGVGAYGVAYERHQVSRISRDLPVRGLPPALDGLRIGMITDVHHSAVVPATDVARAVALLQDASPDIVVLGGDYVSFFDRHYIGPVAELLAPLSSAPHGSFAVLGNHDDEKEVPAALMTRGFTVLKDQRTQLTIRGEQLDLAGIKFWTRTPGDIAGVLKGTGGTTLLLAHDPRRLIEAAALDVQLVLSGHTHGGQVLLPAVGAVVGRKFPVLSGYATRENTSIFVSRGIGTVYLPVRVNCPPDVAVLTLRSADPRS
ncbi:MAG: metallophosphoesterase [Acidimicrobiia bacterium]|nr:metallophosphoesterase [Acidimicrobiia bacterium]